GLWPYPGYGALSQREMGQQKESLDPGERRDDRWSVVTGDVEEPALVVLLQVGEVVAEAGEVVAGADLEVVADAAVGADQPAPAFAAVGDVEAAGLGQGIPLVAQAQAQLQGSEHGAGIQPGTGAAAEAVFAVAHGDLGTTRR